MVTSMTGYGRYNNILFNKDILVEIKSVNHRFFECNVKTPKFYGYLDDIIKKEIKKNINRGKIDVGVYITSVNGEPLDINLNLDVVNAYKKALLDMSFALDIENDIKVSTLSQFSDIFFINKTSENEEDIINSVMDIVNVALKKFKDMREIEGQSIKDDLKDKIFFVNQQLDYIDDKKEDAIKVYEKRLENKIDALVKDINVSEDRVLLEVAVFSEKSSIDEEIVRLKSHILQFEQTIDEVGAKGKKLDFLTQELNREINTIGSKSCDSDITKKVILIKNELEKIREQIQNVE
ncbi:MAG: YicC/YloC family endoribonuclease [Oscillospiraceae bacterium]